MVQDFYIVLSGSSLDRKIDFSQMSVMMPSAYFLNNKGELTKSPYIPEAKKWFLDSGGFTLLSKWEEYLFSIDKYANLILKKKPTYAATMDYPCEPELSNISVKEKIALTVENARRMIENYNFNGTTIVPVIQGWKLSDYKECIDQYRQYGLLGDYVAFGSMCRRMSIKEARRLVIKLTDYLWRFCDANCHFFGFKILFLKDFAIQQRVFSVDTAAWTHNNNGKRRYAKTQEELKRNYYDYMQKVEKILRRYKGQTRLVEEVRR